MVAQSLSSPKAVAHLPTRPIRAQVVRAVRRMRLAAAGLAVLILALLAALLAPWIAPHDPSAVALVDRLQPPLSAGHLLGTDALGQDVLSRVIFGALRRP